MTAIRAKLRVSQAAFARILNVSPKTVQAWAPISAPASQEGRQVPWRFGEPEAEELLVLAAQVSR